MKHVISILLKVLKALPLVVELLQVFTSKQANRDSSGVRKSNENIINDAI